MSTLRILLADDHEVVRRGIRSVIEAHTEWKVCAEADDGVQAVQRTIELQPDVLIIDMSMPRLNGLQATCQILRQLPNQRILLLTMYESETILRDALQVGVRGLVLKSDASLSLTRAVEALAQNKTFFMPRSADHPGENASLIANWKSQRLSAQERPLEESCTYPHGGHLRCSSAGR